jgi:hypothetical protein
MGCSETHFIRTGRGEADERGGIVRRPSREVPTLRQPDVTKARIEAGKRLAIDPTVVVPCPVCGNANLVVQDVPIEGSKKFERIMRCLACGSQNILLMTRKGSICTTGSIYRRFETLRRLRLFHHRCIVSCRGESDIGRPKAKTAALLTPRFATSHDGNGTRNDAWTRVISVWFVLQTFPAYIGRMRARDPHDDPPAKRRRQQYQGPPVTMVTFAPMASGTCCSTVPPGSAITAQLLTQTAGRTTPCSWT